MHFLLLNKGFLVAYKLVVVVHILKQKQKLWNIAPGFSFSQQNKESVETKLVAAYVVCGMYN